MMEYLKIIKHSWHILSSKNDNGERLTLNKKNLLDEMKTGHSADKTH
jgi:hypothetical protein